MKLLVSICFALTVLFFHQGMPAAIQLTEHVLLPKEADSDLEAHAISSVKKVQEEFLRRGGTLVRLGNPSDGIAVQILPGDAVYPVCSAGFCRSQTLWVLLKPFNDKIVLFPPVGARYGFDPYNGKINWNFNIKFETVKDEFTLWAKEPKATRFGYREFGHWRGRETASQEDLRQVAEFFNKHFFGPESSWKGNKGQRRVYLTFDRNTHVVLYRLIQNNENLNQVVVAHFPFRDLISEPPPEWNTVKNSAAAYEEYSKILKPLLDFSKL